MQVFEIVIALLLVARRSLKRIRMRARARRIGLAALPTSEQLRLARPLNREFLAERREPKLAVAESFELD